MCGSRPDVFLVPSSNDDAMTNFERTVLEGVPSRRIVDHSGIQFASESRPVWGTHEGNLSEWEQMEEGDYLFFYQSGAYPYVARILTTEENDSLSTHLW